MFLIAGVTAAAAFPSFPLPAKRGRVKGGGLARIAVPS